MKHVITALVENRPGVLARIVGVISGRGFNIESLNVAPTQDASDSRLTMTVPGDDRVLEQVTKQLNKLVDVIKVSDLTKKRYLNRELVLVEPHVHGRELDARGVRCQGWSAAAAVIAERALEGEPVFGVGHLTL